MSSIGVPPHPGGVLVLFSVFLKHLRPGAHWSSLLQSRRRVWRRQSVEEHLMYKRMNLPPSQSPKNPVSSNSYLLSNPLPSQSQRMKHELKTHPGSANGVPFLQQVFTCVVTSSTHLLYSSICSVRELKTNTSTNSSLRAVLKTREPSLQSGRLGPQTSMPLAVPYGI